MNDHADSGAAPAGQSAPTGQRRDRDREPGRDRRQIARLFEQLPPHAIEAEMSLLGSMLLDPQVVGDVVLVVKGGEDFYRPANGAIYDAMVELYDQHAALDIVQLNQLLADRDSLSTVGGLKYLVELANAVPSASNARHYARLVREKASIRHLIDAAGDILYEAYHSPDEPQSILEEAEQKIFRIAEQSEQTHADSLQTLVDQTMKLIEANEGRLITGIPTGYSEIDDKTHGLQRGEMIIVAARPSMGKTALALNVAEQMALQKHPVGIFSMEMSKLQLVQRLLSSRARVDSHKIRRGMLNHDDYHRLHIACDELLDAQILIDDTPGLTLLQLRAKARRMVAKHRVDAIIIDYMQLMGSGRRVESRQQEISEISRGIKAMARELNVPVICLSQLNRAAEQREGHRPRMSDLRESGSIEQDADVIMMLHREEYYHQGDQDWAVNNPEKCGIAEVILAKQRNGPTGVVKLSWVSEFTRFYTYSPAHAPAEYREPKGSSARSAAFAPAASSGPVADFRDGGGPDAEEVGGIPI
ncbi:MAG: replicative DNA helicase [Planctomycetes bacterium]|nr:replicative DNA helicase [Planctomycetota bacterium]